MKLPKALTLLFLVLASHSFASDEFKFTSAYTVPGSFELAPFATFAVQQASFSVEEDLVKISYTLPPALIGGKSVQISLAGQKTNKFVNVEDAALGVNGQCLVEAHNVNCLLDYNLLYNQLELDKDVIKNFMKQEFAHDPNLEQLLKIGEIFAEDPIGVLNIRREMTDDTP